MQLPSGLIANTWAAKGVMIAEHVVLALVALIIGYVISRYIAKAFDGVFRKRGQKTIAHFLSRLMFYLLMLVVLVAVLSILGVPTGSLIAVLGGMSLAVGLSLRSSLSNLASGILLVIFRPFKVGDQITVGSSVGEVKAIELLFTTLIAETQQQIYIPNDQFLKNAVIKEPSQQ